MPWSFLNSATIQSTTALSKLSPPRWLSPAVDLTSKTPSASSRTDTSNVPPPRAKTRIVWSCSFSRPYASAAAVGSLMMRRTLSPATLPASFVASRCALLKYAGTVITASVTGSPRYASASCFSFWSTIALISGGAYSLPSTSTRTSPFEPCTTLYGTIVISSFTSENFRPMKRLIEKIVFCGFVTCWRRAGVPTSLCPSFVNATTDGVVRPPSAFGMTVGSPPSSTAMHEFVVPRSIPIVFAIPVNCLLVRKSKPFYSRSRDRPNGLLILLGGACWLVHGNRAADKERGAYDEGTLRRSRGGDGAFACSCGRRSHAAGRHGDRRAGHVAARRGDAPRRPAHDRRQGVGRRGRGGREHDAHLRRGRLEQHGLGHGRDALPEPERLRPHGEHDARLRAPRRPRPQCRRDREGNGRADRAHRLRRHRDRHARVDHLCRRSRPRRLGYEHDARPAGLLELRGDGPRPRLHPGEQSRLGRPVCIPLQHLHDAGRMARTAGRRRVHGVQPARVRLVDELLRGADRAQIAARGRDDAADAGRLPVGRRAEPDREQPAAREHPQPAPGDVPDRERDDEPHDRPLRRDRRGLDLRDEPAGGRRRVA